MDPQLNAKTQKTVMEVGRDVSNGLLSVETKSRQTGWKGRERKCPPPPTTLHPHTFRRPILRQLTLWLVWSMIWL